MNLDKYGLPIQSDGDGNDQLNRVGMIICANLMKGVYPGTWFHKLWTFLHVGNGIFKRHTEGDPRNVSADQLIPIACASLLGDVRSNLELMERAMFKRWGFAQNVVDGLNGDNTKKKIPDLMILRAMPIFSRHRKSRYLWDLYLIVMLISDWIYMKTNKDPADVNCTLATFATCSKINPTPISAFVWKVWPKIRDVNQAMARYHRTEAGGNPEIAEIWKL
jgi:hypothetical protein